jgi:quinol monooxygenase YgiN
MTVITRHLTILTSPARAMGLERLWHQAIAPILFRQPSCVRVELLRNREQPGEYIGVTEWQGQEAISEYMASDDFSQLLLLLQDLSQTVPTLTTYETVSNERGAPLPTRP